MLIVAVFFGVLLAVWIVTAVWSNGYCDWCNKWEMRKTPNPGDLGWSNSNGLCRSCAVADAMRPEGDWR